MGFEARRPPALEDIAADTLTGDVRDFLMGWVRNMPKPWPQMSEKEQKDFASATSRQVETLIGSVCSIVASQGTTAFEVKIGDFNKKGRNLEAKLSTPFTFESLTHLAEASEASSIMLTTLSREQFRGERAPASVMRDQPDLGLDDEAEEAQPAEEVLHDENGVVLNADGSEAIAVDAQAAAMADAGEQGEIVDGEILPPEGEGETIEALGPEAEANTALLQAGIQQLEQPHPAEQQDGEAAEPQALQGQDGAPAEDGAEPVGAAPAKTRKPRRTTDQIVADRLAAAEQPAPERVKRRGKAASEQAV